MPEKQLSKLKSSIKSMKSKKRPNKNRPDNEKGLKPRSSLILKGLFQAQHLVVKAQQYDFDHQLQDAITGYTEAAKHLAFLLQKIADIPRRQMWIDQASLCIKRARQLRLMRTTPQGDLSKHDFSMEELKDRIRARRFVPDPHLSWTDVIGLDAAVLHLQEAVFFPLQHPELLEGRLTFARNILLFGPPSCGKTHLIRVLASEVDIPVFCVSAATLLSKWLGESPYPITVTTDYVLIPGKDKTEVIEKESLKSLGFLEDSSQYPLHPYDRMFIYDNKLVSKISLDMISFWDISTLQEVFIFTAEEYISSFLLTEDFLLVGTDICMELGDSCSINVWSLPNLKCVTHLGEFQDTFVFDMKISRDTNANKLYLVAATINTVDIWEWKTWRHIARIEDLVDVNQCQLVNGKLLVGDIYGRVSIWIKTNSRI